MSSEDTNARQKIINAALRCIEKDGIDSITIRSIALEAQVNSAAVNYYFGSKENLMKEIYRITLNNAFSDLDDYVAGKEGRDLYNGLRDFFSDWIQGMTAYPNISKAHLYDPLFHNTYSEDFTTMFNSFLSQLEPIVRKMSPDLSRDSIHLLMIQVFSAVIFPGLLPDRFEDYAEIDFKNRKQQKKYVDFLLRHYFPEFQ